MDRSEALRILAAHRDELRDFGVGRVWLFGSVARDDAGEGSDVDLLVELERSMGFAFFRLKPLLESWFGCPVDVNTVDGLRDGVRERVLREAIRAA